MQILLRRYNNKYYVWKEAKLVKDKFVDDYGITYDETDIIAIKDGDGGKHVVCKYCRETIKNTPEDIEKHFLEQEAKRDCLKCQSMRINSNGDIKRTITKNANGKYDVVDAYTARLHCGYSYQDPDTELGKSLCKHNQHRASGVEAIGGTLMESPNLFEKQITVEALKAKGFTFLYRDNGYFVYDLHLRNTLYAYVNEYGIVDYFRASYRNGWRTFYYSATQNKLFFDGGGKYFEGLPGNWSDNKYNMVRKKIESLYKEDKAK